MAITKFDKEQIPDDLDSGIPEAPSDGNLYSRKDGSWSRVGTVNMADFIVEQSINRDATAGWVWDKYASGRADCWIRRTISAGATGGDGSLFRSDIGTLTYPFSFIEIPHEEAAIIGSDTAILDGLFSQTLTTTGNYRSFSATTKTARTLYLNIKTTGRYSATPVAPLPQNAAYQPNLTFHNPNAFIYTTTKQDTGRTTSDGQVIWGQKFIGTITAAANTAANVVLATTPAFFRFVDGGGSWEYNDALVGAILKAGQGHSSATYLSGFNATINGTLVFSSLSAGTRTNRPYDVWIDYIDGTLRSSNDPNALPHFKPNVTIENVAVPVPVDGIYETLNPTNPAILWPGTAWASLGEGRFTIGAGGTYVAGTTGGSNTLTAAQMPSHIHGPSNQFIDGCGMNGSPNRTAVCSGGGLRPSYNIMEAAGSDQPHTHPYIVVYRWRRLPNVGPVSLLNLQEISQLIQQTNLADIANEMQILRAERELYGATVTGASIPFKFTRMGKLVTVTWSGGASNTAVTNNTTIATIPAGYRPRDTYSFITTCNNSGAYTGAFMFYNAGQINFTMFNLPAACYPMGSGCWFTNDAYPPSTDKIV